jgi:hypothetical protein
MKIKLKEITVREVINGYANNDEEGVAGFDGKLNIRPKYQREFVYKDKQRNAVINTVQKNFPLNVLYWAENEDDTFEVLDGQQRLISICEYVSGSFAIKGQYFHNLTKEEQNNILDYTLMIYFCKGTDKEKLDWFKTINIAGVKLTEQELRNAIYTGTWLTDAKKYLSKSGCPAYTIAKNYLKGVSIRQDYLETALKWISQNHIEEYMASKQHDPNANELWLYFKSVIDWVEITFPMYRKEMKGVEWGTLYDNYKNEKFDIEKLEQQILELMQNEDVTKKSGIYYYVLSGDTSKLNIRTFNDKQKREAYEKQKGVCAKCGKHFKLEEMEADHITPWSEGGKTTLENCQMLCKHDNRIKAAK